MPEAHQDDDGGGHTSSNKDDSDGSKSSALDGTNVVAGSTTDMADADVSGNQQVSKLAATSSATHLNFNGAVKITEGNTMDPSGGMDASNSADEGTSENTTLARIESLKSAYIAATYHCFSARRAFNLLYKLQSSCTRDHLGAAHTCLHLYLDATTSSTRLEHLGAAVDHFQKGLESICKAHPAAAAAAAVAFR